jgi:hypothetical protein
MVAWSILCIFIGRTVPIGSAGPSTFTPSVHFPFCNCSAQEISSRGGTVVPHGLAVPRDSFPIKLVRLPLDSCGFLPSKDYSLETFLSLFFLEIKIKN